MNKREKKEDKKRFNLLDLLIVVVIIAILGGGWYVYSKYIDAQQKNKTAIEYEVELKGVDENFLNAIAKGDPLRESVKGNNLGFVEQKLVVPASNINTDFLNGRYVAVPVPDKQDLILKISAVASVSDRSITVGGLEIKIGQKIFVKGKGYAKEGYVLNIDIKE